MPILALDSKPKRPQMTTTIYADCVLAAMFSSGWQEVSTRDLNHFREQIESKAGDLFIDVTGDSICMVTDERPDMFDWSEDVVRPVTVGMSKGFFSRHYVEDYFMWRVPKEHRELFWNTAKVN